MTIIRLLWHNKEQNQEFKKGGDFMIFVIPSFFLIQSKLNINQLHYFTRSSAVDIHDIIIINFIVVRVFAQYMGIVMLLRMLKMHAAS